MVYSMMNKKKIKKFLIGVLIVASFLYIIRVYNINHSEILDYLPQTAMHNMDEVVAIPSGFYNQGYTDMRGYFMEVKDCKLIRLADLSSEGYIQQNEIPLLPHTDSCEYVMLIKAVFHFEGNGDPLKGVIDLSNFSVVGSDYYMNYSSEFNELALFNKFLNGSSQFSIASGKHIEVILPFLIPGESPWRIEPEYIIGDNISLLFSRYPSEEYINLDIS